MPTPWIHWPSTLAIDNPAFQIENASKGGGPSLSGKEQIVGSGSSRWTAKFDVAVGSRGETFCYRAVLDWLQGRANTILISPCEPSWSPNAIAGGNALDSATFSDTATFSDGSVFSQDGTYAYFVAQTLAQSSTATIFCQPAPAAGQFFGVENLNGDTFDLYRIAKLTSLGGNQYNIEFRPALRRDTIAVPAQRLVFGRPLGQMRLTADLSGELTRSKSGLPMPALALVEVF